MSSRRTSQPANPRILMLYRGMSPWHWITEIFSYCALSEKPCTRVYNQAIGGLGACDISIWPPILIGWKICLGYVHYPDWVNSCTLLRQSKLPKKPQVVKGDRALEGEYGRNHSCICDHVAEEIHSGTIAILQETNDRPSNLSGHRPKEHNLANWTQK